jgi:arginine repressor
LPEHFRIKVTTIEFSKDLEEMKIEELVGSLQTNEYSLPPVRKENLPSRHLRHLRRNPESHMMKTLTLMKMQ